MMRRVHATLTCAWLIAAVPSMIWWSHSVPYLVFLSVYAAVASHWSAWQGARAESAANDDEKKVSRSDG